MNKQKRNVTDYDVLTAMERYGGGFVSNLAKACFHAGYQNLTRIKLAFADLWLEYGKLAKHIEEEKNENPPL